MKKLSFEKMEKIEGGLMIPSFDSMCQIYGWAVAVGSGASAGSDEFEIIASIGYKACWMAM